MTAPEVKAPEGKLSIRAIRLIRLWSSWVSPVSLEPDLTDYPDYESTGDRAFASRAGVQEMLSFVENVSLKVYIWPEQPR